MNYEIGQIYNIYIELIAIEILDSRALAKYNKLELVGVHNLVSISLWIWFLFLFFR